MTHLLTEVDQETINLMLLDRFLLPSLANIPSLCLWACVLIKRCLLCNTQALMSEAEQSSVTCRV